MTDDVMRHFYVEDYADEIMPCAPTLEGWAHWLSIPDHGWPHPIPAEGEVFKLFTLDQLGVITATLEGKTWRFSAPVPEGATTFYCRAGYRGWDVESCSETPLGYLDDGVANRWYESGAVEELVCVKDGPSLVAIYHADPPRLVVVGEVQ